MIIAANWKMNPAPSAAASLFADYAAEDRITGATAQILCFVPSCYFSQARQTFDHTSVEWGAQSCHFETSGAFTGEISAEMISGSGGKWVLAGHSERRSLFAETDEIVAAKLVAAVHAGLSVILCVGEMQAQRQNDEQNDYVAKQLKASLSAFCEESPDWQSDHLSKVVIAYEPVWAIGTGLVATTDQIEDMHNHIHSIMAELFSFPGTPAIPPVLYGGSVKQDNADAILSLPAVGGALIGGAPLSADSFAAIVSSADAVM